MVPFHGFEDGLNYSGETWFAFDGFKLPANASGEWSSSLAELEKKKAKTRTKGRSGWKKRYNPIVSR